MRLAAMFTGLMAMLMTALPAAAAAAGVEPAHPLTRADVEAWLDGLIPAAMASGDIPGGVVVVVKDGQILAEKGYGFADVKRRVRVDPARTLFRPGSISKTFTWTAVMQLVEAGKLDLDADVNRYLDFRIPPKDGRPLTLRNIMTHTSGFEEKLKGLLGHDDKATLDRWIKDWTPRRIFAPGTTPAYSNYAAALAGYIVQRVSGEPYAQYEERHILAPLGMASSSFRQPLPADLQARMAKGYLRGSGPEGYFEFTPAAPTGGLSATGEDMGRYMIAQLQNGRYGSAQILRPETAIALHAVQPKVYPALNGMALGFYEHSRNGHRVIAHNGGTVFFHSDMHLFVDDGVGIFISLNSPGPGRAASRIHDALFHGFTDRYFPAPPLPAEPGVDAATARAHARLMAGQWESSRRSDSSFMSITGLLGPMQVTANDDGTIGVPIPFRGVVKWREIAPFLWREVGGQEKLQAIIKDGRPVMFGLDMAPPAAFMPIPGWRSPAWIMPALAAALGCVLITLVLWPIAAVVRRRYGAPARLSGAAGRVAVATKAAAGLSAAAITGFVVALAAMSADAGNFADASDPVFLTLQTLATLVVVPAALLGLVNLVLGWRPRAGWLSRSWSAALAASVLVLAYVALAFHLVGFDVNY